jgi:MoaA/NifB/PqqE/SkfB family radical SAM enzyme
MKPGAELTVSEVRGVFEKLGHLDVVRVSGGEPFLREDIEGVVDAIMAVSRPLVLHVTTNGSLPDRVEPFASRFRQPKRLSIMVSLDGHRDVHDANRGADVTYDTAFDTIRRLVRLRRSRGIDVSVNYTVISPTSVEDAIRVRGELSALGVDMHIVLAYSGSATYDLRLRGKRADHLIVPSGYPLHPDLVGADVIGLVERELSSARTLSSRLRRMGKVYYLQGLLARLRRDPQPRPNPKCVELRSHVRIMPDGSVPVCQFNGETVGNLNTASREDVLNSPAATRARSWVDACSGCWAECEVIPSAIYSGDLLIRRRPRSPPRQ